MTKIGRNTPCPCGSGKKYKTCCSRKGDTTQTASAYNQRTRFEPGSYGAPPQFFPSLMGYRECADGEWEAYYCLVKKNICLDTEAAAVTLATKHLEEAFEVAAGNPAHVAQSLKHHGYKSVQGYKWAEE